MASAEQRQKENLQAQALDYESYVLSVTMKSEDFKEGFTAFLEKREPVFKGK
jgi:2-(1,2-epoxy-1,2-dihydrophenyl)acetyl-CoA isomerase